MSNYTWRGGNGSLSSASNWFNGSLSNPTPTGSDSALFNVSSRVFGTLRIRVIIISATMTLSGSTTINSEQFTIIGDNIAGTIDVGGQTLYNTAYFAVG